MCLVSIHFNGWTLPYNLIFRVSVVVVARLGLKSYVSLFGRFILWSLGEVVTFSSTIEQLFYLGRRVVNWWAYLLFFGPCQLIVVIITIFRLTFSITEGSLKLGDDGYQDDSIFK